MSSVNRIGVLTSGGDCAGLNPVIRAVTYSAINKYGWEVFGIHNGTSGLLQRPLAYEILTLERCKSALLSMGGTILGATSRGNPFYFPSVTGEQINRAQDFYNAYRELELDALIGVGGDGSMRILRRLAQEGGINLVTIPKTIDNDLGRTDMAIGYATAVDVATEALDRLQPTAASHQRVIILEVMGRDAGHIALASGIAGGADVILIPEIPYNFSAICSKLANLSAQGQNYALIIVAEAVRDEAGRPVVVEEASSSNYARYGGIGYYLSERLSQLTQAECRVMVLGHVQRGSIPNAQDRLLASALGTAAVDLVAQGKFDHMVAWQNHNVVAVPIADATKQYQVVDPKGVLIQTARDLTICLGDI